MTDTSEPAIQAGENNALQQAIGLHQQGRLQQAVAIYQDLLEQNPDDADALHYMGMASCSSGDIERGFEYIGKALRIKPDYVEAINNLGVIYMGMGNMEGAEACYRRVIEIDPNHADSHSNLGVVQKRLGQLQDAVDSFQEALMLDPDHARAHHNLGNLYRRAGHYDEAAPHYRAAIEGGMNSSESKHALIHAMIQNDDQAGAVALLEDWLKVNPEDPVAAHLWSALTGGAAQDRAPDAYVKTVFDKMAGDFDENLGDLGYRAPGHVIAILNANLASAAGDLDVLDAGCGTGLCGPLVRPLASRLVGVDLSVRMLEKAQLTGSYDELVEAELVHYLQGQATSFDVIICADTLCYFGDLEEVTLAAFSALRPGGRFVFTVEKQEDDQISVQLQPSGRYRHGSNYARRVLEAAGFTVVTLTEEVLRQEGGTDVRGLVINALAAPTQ